MSIENGVFKRLHSVGVLYLPIGGNLGYLYTKAYLFREFSSAVTAL